MLKSTNEAGASADRTSAGGAAVIDIERLSLAFVTNDGPVQALSDINLKIGRGEFVSLIAYTRTEQALLDQKIITQKPTGAWTHDITTAAGLQ